MYFLYIDGSGNPSLKDTTDEHYVLGGVAIQEEGIKLVEKELSVEKYFPGNDRPDELKLTAIQHGKWWKGVPEDKKQKIIDDVVDLVGKTGAALFVIVVDKPQHKNKYTSPEDPCILALRFLITRFSRFLNRNGSYGAVVYDRDRETDIFQAVRRWKSNGLLIAPLFKNQMPEKVVETIFFLDSKYSPCMWIADFWARSVFVDMKRPGYPLYQRLSKNLDIYGRCDFPKK